MNFSSEKMKKIKPSGIRELFAKSQGIEGVISLGIGVPDIHTPQELKEALKQAVEDNYNNYDQTPGNKRLREAIVEKYKRDYKTDYNSSEGVIVTCGGVQLIYIVLQTYISQGDEVLIQDPCFLTYPRQIFLAGGKAVWLDSTPEFSIDLEKMKERITPKTKMIILNYPSNPTGAMLTKEETKAIVDLAEDNNLIIISDEVYEYYTFDNQNHIHIASIGNAYERTITANSFSKTYAIPGWRMGFGVSTPELLKPVLSYHAFVVANATTPTQVALANYMLTKKAEEFKKKIKNIFEQRRNLIVDGFNSLDGITCKKPEGSFYCYPDVSESNYPNSEEFSRVAFEKTKIVLVPGTEFGPKQTNNLRASFGSVSKEKIKEVIERLKEIT